MGRTIHPLAALITALTVSSAHAALDQTPDVLARLTDRPAEVPDFAMLPVAEQDAWWFERGASGQYGLVGEHRSGDGIVDPSDTTITLGLVAKPMWPHGDTDQITIGTTMVNADPIAGASPDRTGVFASYGWRATPRAVIQPGLGWSIDAIGELERTTVSLGLSIEF